MRTFQRIIGGPGLHNLGVVTDSEHNPVFRSAKPKAYGLLYQLGIGTVLDLQDNSDEELFIREKLCSAVQIVYKHLRLNILSEITVEDFDLIVKTLSNPLGGSKLVHCQSGADRTGAACAAYRMAMDGWSFAEAWEELECYGGGIHNLLNIKLKYHLEKYAKVKRFSL